MSEATTGPLDLRLIVITDASLARPHTITTVARAALAAGAPALQLRDKSATARDLLAQADALLPIAHEHGALLFINDRVDIALLAGADGAHLGPEDLPIAAARTIVPPGFLLGWSTDDPVDARRAEREGASYIGCGAVFGTRTKTEAAGERIGVARLDEVARAVRIPVVGIGGIDEHNSEIVAGTRASGVAVVSAVMAARYPGAAVRALLSAWERGRRTRRVPEGEA
ncbi:MAG: thiamine phosphate synthase [Gemmatimonadetes bacterium]|nr:thiamine phosphate synthase [Gemmatimonadota bacterium]